MELSELIDFVLAQSSSLWNATYVVLTSSLGEVIIGTFIASFAGVMGAHVLTERFKRKDQYLHELRSTNAAIMSAFEICNSMLSLKKQHVIELLEGHAAAREMFEQQKQAIAAGTVPQGTVFNLVTDFRSLPLMKMPDAVLIKLVFERISSPPRAQTLTNTLTRTIDSLNVSIKQRNEMIDHWKALPAPTTPAGAAQLTNEMISFYFGLRSAQGHVDTSYVDSLTAIGSQTDDCIQFSYMLAIDLNKHGEKVRKKFGRQAPKVNKPSFDKAADQGLMPDEDNYEGWASMFVEHSNDSILERLKSLFKFKNRED